VFVLGWLSVKGLHHQRHPAAAVAATLVPQREVGGGGGGGGGGLSCIAASQRALVMTVVVMCAGGGGREGVRIQCGFVLLLVGVGCGRCSTGYLPACLLDLQPVLFAAHTAGCIHSSASLGWGIALIYSPRAGGGGALLGRVDWRGMDGSCGSGHLLTS